MEIKPGRWPQQHRLGTAHHRHRVIGLIVVVHTVHMIISCLTSANNYMDMYLGCLSLYYCMYICTVCTIGEDRYTPLPPTSHPLDP